MLRRIGNFFFRNRSYTPIPILLLALILAEPSGKSLFFGFLIVVMGEGLRLWAIRYAGSATRTSGRVGADELVTTGPYGHLRNPLYLGNFLISSGLIVMAWPWMPWFLLIVLALTIFQYLTIILAEEEFLRQKFPQEYAVYEKHVPRILFRLKGWNAGSRKPTNWRKALHTERRSLQSQASVSLLLVFLWIVC
ncbi:isoprenylcysteine carboxylmethyltransferase family protein [candidate division KSB1 bacterium]|nr:isoprenylcysteine carboxylmethyltransferase family protein [candidate division KSB1 bacterium]